MKEERIKKTKAVYLSAVLAVSALLLFAVNALAQTLSVSDIVDVLV